jgi:hypothetical protein
MVRIDTTPITPFHLFGPTRTRNCRRVARPLSNTGSLSITSSSTRGAEPLTAALASSPQLGVLARLETAPASTPREPPSSGPPGVASVIQITCCQLRLPSHIRAAPRLVGAAASGSPAPRPVNEADGVASMDVYLVAHPCFWRQPQADGAAHSASLSCALHIDHRFNPHRNGHTHWSRPLLPHLRRAFSRAPARVEHPPRLES